MVLFSYFPPALLSLSLLFSQAFSLFPHSHQINALSGDFAQKQPRPGEEPVALLELLLATEKKTKLQKTHFLELLLNTVITFRSEAALYKHPTSRN